MSDALSTVADTAGVEIEEEPAAPDVTNGGLVERLVAQARVDGVQLAGEGGLLQQLTKRVLESGPRGRDHRPSRVRQARPGWSQRRQLPQRGPVEDGDH